MIVEKVRNYNQKMMVKWRKDCDVWRDENYKNPMPPLAFYCFYTEQGNERQTGYVASHERTAIWRPTKKESLQEIEKCL